MGKRVLVLNAYTLTSRRAEDLVRFRAFLEGLEQCGYQRGRDVDVDILDSNRLCEMETLVREALREHVDLIHAVGTPNALLAVRCGAGVPVVYYGAHPEGAGEVACREAGAVGLLTLPFTQNYKPFRLIRTLFPNVKQVWAPFYEDTVFCQPEMKSKHRLHRSRNENSPWLKGGSPEIGHRGLAGLCYIIGVEYREFVYRDCNDLLWGLEFVDRNSGLVMPYNDSIYCEAAPETLMRFTVEHGIPLFWNNNTEATRIGAVAAISACFRWAGIESGKIAAAILDGAAPRTFPWLTSTKTYKSLNLPRAQALGLAPPPNLINQFDEVLRS
jgi:ABC-type uncharacterized transport system substrate-binding protein